MYALKSSIRPVCAPRQLRVGSLHDRNLYSSLPNKNFMEVMEATLRKARAGVTSNKKAVDSSRIGYKQPNLSKRPTIGGHARNNLKPPHASIPILKPIFAQEEPDVPKTTSNAPPKSPETKESSLKPSSESQGIKENSTQSIGSSSLNKQPEPALGAARFFFLGRGTQDFDSSQLPSASWTPPANTQSHSSKGDQAARSGGGNNSRGISGRKNADKPESSAIGGTAVKRPLTDKAINKHTIEAGSLQQRVPKRADGKSGKQPTDSSKGKPAQKHRISSAPRRHGQRVLHEDNEDDNKMKRRRKKFKLPKKGQEVVLPVSITVDGLAKLLEVPNDHLLRKMANIGMDKLANNFLLTNEEAAEIALEYEVVPIIPENKGPELLPRPIPEDMSVHPTRPPVVTIMGHVDHGKTTLLDTLRNSTITASEAGGITQHIGAFSVKLAEGGHITFLDTPGHAAFSAMRARGANATDIVVLVVAADDGVMPQTREAIQHALDADVPIIVAINKCDKPGVDPARVQEELLKYGVQTEEMGGDIQSVKISALHGTGVDELSENIATLAEVLDLRAEVDIPAHATVIESQVERGRGNVASLLVKRGTLRVGDVIVAGTAWCKVRSMTDDHGNAVQAATPATAVRVMGWKEIPQAGDMALQAESESQAKDVVANRIEKRKNRDKLQAIGAMNEKRREVNERETGERAEEKAYRRALWEYRNGLRDTAPEPLPKKTAVDLDTSGDAAKAEQQVPVVPVVIKGDVSGTVEAVAGALKQLPDKKIRISVISTGVGPVTESDVAMAGSGSQGLVVAFNVKADKKTLNAAKREKVEVMTFRVIYKLLEDIEKVLTSRLEPLRIEEVQGEAVVQEVFEVTLKGNKVANIAGSRVTIGSITKNSKVRLLRNGKELFTGDISSLRNVKHDISEVSKGQEFGVCLEGFNDIKEGDMIHSLRYKEVPQKLE